MLAAAALSLAPGAAAQTTINWGGGNGNGNLPPNWAGGKTPGASDNARVSGGVVSFDTNTSVNALIFTGGKISGSKALTAASSESSWTDGDFTGSGSTVIAAGAVFTLSGAAHKNLYHGSSGSGGRTLDNYGTILWTDQGGIRLGDGASIINRAGALFAVRNDASLAYIGFGNRGTFTNAGTFTKSIATGTTTIAESFLNTGSVRAESGTLAFEGTTSGNGEYYAAAGATNTFANSVSFADGTRFTGEGRNDVVGGTAVFAGSISSTNLSLLGGTYSGSAVVSGHVHWSGGTVVGAGTLAFAGGEFVIDGTATKSLRHGGSGSGGAVVRVDDRAVWTDSGVIRGSEGAGIRVAGTGVFEIRNDSSYAYDGLGNRPFFDNAGILRKVAPPVVGTATPAAAGTTTFSQVNLTNSGSIEVQSGTLLVTDSVFNQSGNVTVSSGALFTLAGGSGSGSAGGRVQVESGGAFRLTGGTLSLAGTTFAGTGTSEIAGGTAVATAPVLIGAATGTGRFVLSSGALGGTATVTVGSGSTFSWTGGALTGSSTLQIAAGGNLTIEGSAAKSLYHGASGSGGHVVANAGLVTWLGSGNLLGGDGASIVNQAGGTFDIRGDATVGYIGFGNGLTFTNAGTLRKSAGTLTTFNQTLANSGSVEVTAGTLAIAGGGSSSGRLGATGDGLLALTSAFTVTGGTFFGSGGTRIAAAVAVTGPTGLGSAGETGLLTLVQGGTIGGGGRLTIGSDSRLDWTGGAQTGGGTTEISAGGLLALLGSDVKTLYHGASGSGGRTLDNSGSILWAGTGNLLAGDGARILNREAGVITLAADATLGYVGFGNGFSIVNAGTLRRAGSGGTFTVASGALTNTGRVVVEEGVLALNGGGTASGGTFDARAGAVLTFGSNFSFDGAELAGAGRIRASNSTLSFTGNTTGVSGFLELPADSAIGGGGTLAVAGTLEWTGGSMLQNGTTRIDAAGSLLLTGVDAKYLYHGGSGSGGRRIENFGLVALRGTGALMFGDGASFYNRAGATFDITADAGLGYAGFGNAGYFENSGLLQKSAGLGNSAVAGVSFVNQSAGQIWARTGTLVFDETFTNQGGTVTASLGASVRFGGGAQRTFGTGTRFTGDGQKQIVAGQTLFNGAFTARNLLLAGGTFGGTAPVLHGDLLWTGGSWTGGGQFTVASDGLVTLDGSGSKLFYHGGSGSGGRQLVNEGQVVFQGTGSLLLGDGASIANRAGGVFVLRSDATIGYAGFGNNGSFTNDGTLVKSAGTGTSTIAVPFVNNGTLTVTSGSLVFTGGFTNNQGNIVLTGGSLDLPGSTLDLGTAALAGTGTITAATVHAAGVVAPGNSPGQLTLTGNLTLASTSSLLIELGGRTQGVGYDFLSIGGNAALAGTLNLTFTAGFESTIAPTDTFTILSAASLSGVFTNAALDQTRLLTTDGLGSFVVGYTANGVTLSQFVAVPEPSTWALMLLGAATVLVSVWRRRR